MLGAIILVALIYFIYIPYKAWRLSKNPEWIENQKKIKELEKKANDLQAKANKSYEEYQQMLAAKAAKQNRAYAAAMATNRNTKTFQSTNENKTSIGGPKNTK